MVLVLAHARLTVGADCPLEKSFGWLTVGTHVESTDACWKIAFRAERLNNFFKPDCLLC